MTSVGIVIGAGDVAMATVTRLRDTVDQIIALDISTDALGRLPDTGTGTGDITGLVGDINDEGARDALIRAVQESGHTIEWVVLTAGVGARGPLVSLPPDRIASIFATNVVSPILLLQALLQSCSWAAEARIVGLGSISARRPLPERTVYGATKAAFEAFLVALGVELAPRGIIVNVVSAGVIDSAFITAAREDLQGWAVSRVPAARLGRVAEVADLVAYIVRDAPPYLCAARVVIDGGAEALA